MSILKKASSSLSSNLLLFATGLFGLGLVTGGVGSCGGVHNGQYISSIKRSADSREGGPLIRKRPTKVAEKQLCDAIKSGNLDAIKGLVEEQGTAILSKSIGSYTGLPGNWRWVDDEMTGQEKAFVPGPKATALHIAAYFGHLSIVTWFIEQGVSVDVRDKSTYAGSTALHYAAEGRHRSVIEYFISQGADVNAKDCSGYTPLYVAAWNGCLPIVTLLHAKGADLSIKYNEKAMLLYDIIIQGYYGIMRIMKKDGCDIRPVVKYLLSQQGIDLHERDNDQNTMLHHAAKLKRFDIVQCLVEYGVDIINAKNGDGNTALHEAVIEYNSLFSRLLGFDSIRDKAALHDAYNSKSNIAQYLVEHGADPKLPNKRGYLPSHYAKKGSDVKAYLKRIEAEAIQ